MTATLPEAHADAPEPPDRRTGDLTARELLRWGWRQLTSMRTALVLLLLLALAAIPGSVIPQSGVDSLKTSRWQADHPDLTPVYERLGLFSVYDSAWFAAIYILLMVSLVGCIIPRLVRLLAGPARAAARRAATPVAAAGAHLLRDRRVARRRAGPRAGGAEGPWLSSGTGSRDGRQGALLDRRTSWVAAERGYLREAGNLLFHLAVVVVLVGFAVGGLFGYKGGVILVVGNGFSNNLTQYDDFDPGSLFDADGMEPFRFTVDDFDVEWIDDGPAAGDGARLQRPRDLSRDPGRPGPAVRPAGQPPAQDRRHRGLPDRPRLRAGDHDPRRQRRGGLQRADGLPPRGRRLPLVRRGEGARRRAGRDRARGAVLPDVPQHRRQPRQRDGRPEEPHPVDARLHRRPGHGRRHRAVLLRARQVEAHEGDRARRLDVPRRPAGGPVDRPAGRRRLGDLRGRGALEQAPDQPHPRHARHPRRRRAGAGRAAAVAVHPAAAGVGASPSRRRTVRPASTSAASTGRPRATSRPRCPRSWRVCDS